MTVIYSNLNGPPKENIACTLAIIRTLDLPIADVDYIE